jgi:hypothetical protein
MILLAWNIYLNYPAYLAIKEARSEAPLPSPTAVSAREVNEEAETITLVPDSPLRAAPALGTGGGAGAEAHGETVIVSLATTALRGGMEEGEEEEEVDEAFIPPPSSAPPVNHVLAENEHLQ